MFPPIEPYAIHRLPVSHGHTLYVEESGNPQGLPAVFLHGGPGGGTQPSHRQYFNPQRTRIILFDQRGCGQSTPFASLEANTTSHLVEDMETIRTHLNIEKWVVYGNSWGATLALVYAQMHPQRVHGLVVGATLLGHQADADWVHSPHGMASHFPAQFAALSALLPHATPATFAAQAIQAMQGQNETLKKNVARAWSAYEGAAAMYPNPDTTELDAMLENWQWLLPHSLMEAHYIAHHWFLRPNQILEDAAKLHGIPTHILHAAQDMVCPVENARQLHAALPHSSTLTILPAGGHMGTEAMKQARVDALETLATQINA